jgi:hypothetical protein
MWNNCFKAAWRTTNSFYKALLQERSGKSVKIATIFPEVT